MKWVPRSNPGQPRLGGVLLFLCLFVVARFVSGADCNNNGTEDVSDVAGGVSVDCNGNSIPDECEGAPVILGPGDDNFDVAAAPAVTAVGDLDNDGHLDLVVGSNQGLAATVTVLLGGEDRRFTNGSETVVDGDPPLVSASIADISVGDVNDDDKLDVATAHGKFLLVMLGRGNGTFAEPVRYDNDAESHLITMGDIDGDELQLPDLIHASVDNILVRFNQGDGTFGDPVTTPVGEDPRGLVTRDFDLDGDLDIATVNRAAQDFSVLLNQGDGSFAAAVSYPGSVSPSGLGAEDLDLDGVPDLVAVSDSSFQVLINFGNGTFAPTVTYSAEVAAGDTFAVSDFNGDAAPDLVFLVGASVLTVRVNDGTGRFDVSVVVQDFTSAPPTSVKPGDFDGDHLPDIAVARASPSRVEVFWNGDRPPVSLRRETLDIRDLCLETNNRGCRPHWEGIEDLDGDGSLDVIACNTHRGTFTIHLNDGSGNMDVQPGYEFGGEHPQGLDVGDINNDGHIDVVTCDNLAHELWAHLNRGEGDATFEAPTRTAAGNGAVHVKLGHLNADGNLDAVTADEGAGTVSVILGAGDGTFAPRTFYRVLSAPKSTDIADLDGDGFQDVVVANASAASLSFLRNNGDGTFAEALDITLSTAANHVKAVDIDFDGDFDLATANTARQGCTVLINRGDGTFGSGASYPAGLSPFSVAVTDMNLDGHLDLVTSSEIDSSISVLLATDDGRFGQPFVFRSGDSCRHVITGDLDDDGDPDLVTNDREGNSMSFFYNEQRDEEEFLDNICTGAEFHGLSAPIPPGLAADQRFVKYTLPLSSNALPGVEVVAFQNTQLFDLHEQFLRNVFPDQFAGLPPAAYRSLVEFRASRQYFVGTISRLRSPEGYLYGFSVFAHWSDPVEALAPSEVKEIYDQLQRAFHLESFEYFPGDPTAIEVARGWPNPGFPINFEGAPPPPTGREVYTAGTGIGRVRILTAAEFELQNANCGFGFQDILVLAEAPRDIEGVVAGVFTAAPQGPLSHVAVRTNLRRTPNAFMDDALEVFAPFEGKLVRVEVTCPETTITEVGLAEAEAWWDSIRPSIAAPPRIDEDYRDFPSLEEIAAMDQAGVVDTVGLVGGKATGLARLQGILDGEWSEYQEKGFAVPLYYYREFMRTNRMLSAFDISREVTFEEYLDELFASERFLTDSSFRCAALEALRRRMEQGQVAPQLVQDLTDRILEVFGTTTIRVRFRSSSNAEDSVEFNGAGLYDSTSVCAADDLDGDEDGPSQCQAFKKTERGIARGLRTVWTSLWNFRAYEERAFYQMPQRQIGMGVLVNRAFPDEKSNGVAFTGNLLDRFDPRFVVTAQIGEESVVSPQPGVLPETNLLVLEDGAVVEVIRSVASSLMPPGIRVLSRAELDELGALMWHIDQNLPVDTGGHSRDDVILDVEFKFEPVSGDLAVKQVRPFLLVDDGPPPPTFEVVIPPNTTGCGRFVIGRVPLAEYELKSTIRLRGGSLLLPTDISGFEADIVEEVVVGPEREVLTAVGPGRMRRTRDTTGCDVTYRFRYEQSFRFGTGEEIDLVLSQLDFVPGDAGEPFILDDESLIGDVFLRFPPFDIGGDIGQIDYSSCNHETLPLFEVSAELTDRTPGGTTDGTIVLKERFRDEVNKSSGPASIVSATVVLEGQERMVTDYFHLVYSALKHNEHQVYWVVLDPPIQLDRLERPVHVVELRAAFDLTDAAASYLDEDFNVLTDPDVAAYKRQDAILFRRGDCNNDNRTNISDAIQHARMLFRGVGSEGCNKACDSNGDGVGDFSDPIYLIEHLFKGGPPPPVPFYFCGDDATLQTTLSCDRSACE